MASASYAEKKSIFSIYDNYFENEFTRKIPDYESIQQAKELENQVDALDAEIRALSTQLTEIDDIIEKYHRRQITPEELEIKVRKLFGDDENTEEDIEMLEAKVRGYEDHVRRLEAILFNASPYQ